MSRHLTIVNNAHHFKKNIFQFCSHPIHSSDSLTLKPILCWYQQETKTNFYYSQRKSSAIFTLSIYNYIPVHVFHINIYTFNYPFYVNQNIFTVISRYVYSHLDIWKYKIYFFHRQNTIYSQWLNKMLRNKNKTSLILKYENKLTKIAYAMTSP